jgi:DNA-damage-inducible protein D
MSKVQLNVMGYRCERCEHEWVPRDTENEPRVCPKCKSPYWNVPRKNAAKELIGKIEGVDSMDDKKEFIKSLKVADMPMDEVISRAALATREGAKPNETHLEGDTVAFEGECQLTLWNRKEIRKTFHNNEWFFSVVDVIQAITESKEPSRYWSQLKRQISEKERVSQLFANIEQLKMPGIDGKMYLTDTANVETLFRIIQSIPSPKAEPFKRWLARVGYERIEEFQNPEIAVKRAIINWKIQGREDDWIEARLRSIVVRHELTSEWAKRGVQEGYEYGYLTNIISKETFGLKTDEHKKLKGLTSQNLRNHMTDFELVFTMLGEKSTAAIARKNDAIGLDENAKAAHSGGRVAGDARRGLEQELGRSVVSKENFLKGKPESKKLPS